MQPDRRRARELCRAYTANGRPLEWFEALYAEAARGAASVPWADMSPGPLLVDWLEARPEFAPRRSLVIGCGLGDDAEAIARRGGSVTAFDIAPTAVSACQRRFPDSRVEYVTADLLDPPAAWSAAFDFVLEANTLQVLPPKPRRAALERVAGFVAPGGRLLVICRARHGRDPRGEMPWPLTRGELLRFRAFGLAAAHWDELADHREPSVRRFRVEWLASAAHPAPRRYRALATSTANT